MGDRKFYTRWSGSASIRALSNIERVAYPRTTDRTLDGRTS